MPDDVEPMLTLAQAYEAAYRFVWQYYEREPDSESLALMVVAMEPADDYARTSDPASWHDWKRCVDELLSGVPSPRVPRQTTD